MRSAFAEIQKVVAIPTVVFLLLTTSDLPAQAATLPATEGAQVPVSTNPLTRTCQFSRGPRAGKTITFLATVPVRVGSSCTDGGSSTGIAVPENPNPQLTHACQFDQGPRSGQTLIYPQTIPVGALCWDGVTSTGVSISNGLSAQPSSPAPSQAERCDELAASPDDPATDGTSVISEKIDVAKAVPACQAAAELSPNQPRYISEYARALYAAKRYPEAFQEFSQAAGMGYPGAMQKLGIQYLYGNGVQQSDTNAAAWFAKAAALGNPSAMTDLGWMCENGRGVSKSDSDAVTWYRKGADAGNPDAMTGLGRMLRTGSGTQWNEPEAMTWFQKAADLGDAQAEMQLGLGYMNGLGGGRQDYGLAGQWLSKAAQQGNDWAQLNLAILYQNGWGVTQNVALAKTYYGYAAKGDDPQVAQFAAGRLQDLDKQSSDGTVAVFVAGAALLAIIAAASSSSDNSGSTGRRNSAGNSRYDSPPGPGQRGNVVHDNDCGGQSLTGPLRDSQGYPCQ